VLYSNNHLKAEADYRRETLSRSVPLNTPETFHLEPVERRLGSALGKGESLLTRLRSSLGPLVDVHVARATQSQRGSLRNIAVAVMAALMMSAAIPAQADAPEVLELNLIFGQMDQEHEIVVFWNITRDDFCGWVEGGFVGPRPVEALLPVSFQETGKGAVVATSHAKRVIEVWHFADLEAADPCTATAGQSGPLAFGRGLLVMADNDFDVSGTRINAFGLILQARLVGADGSTWHYRLVARGLIDFSGELTERVSFRLFQVGN
jgi:hypothetical protein